MKKISLIALVAAVGIGFNSGAFAAAGDIMVDDGSASAMPNLGGVQLSDLATTAQLAGKADAATTLAGYGITDAYTKAEVDAFGASLESTLMAAGLAAWNAAEAELSMQMGYDSTTQDFKDVLNTGGTIDGAQNVAEAINALDTAMDTKASTTDLATLASTLRAEGEAAWDKAEAYMGSQMGFDSTTQDFKDVLSAGGVIDGQTTVAGALNALDAAFDDYYTKSEVMALGTAAWDKAEAYMGEQLGFDSTTQDFKDVLQAGGAIDGQTSVAGALNALDTALTDTTLALYTYADGVGASTLTAANTYADAAVADSALLLYTYADQKKAEAITYSSTYADAAVAASAALLYTYADAGDAATLTAANTYADGVGAATLTAANTYTDAEVLKEKNRAMAAEGDLDFSAANNVGVQDATNLTEGILALDSVIGDVSKLQDAADGSDYRSHLDGIDNLTDALLATEEKIDDIIRRDGGKDSGSSKIHIGQNSVIVDEDTGSLVFNSGAVGAEDEAIKTLSYLATGAENVMDPTTDGAYNVATVLETGDVRQLRADIQSGMVAKDYALNLTNSINYVYEYTLAEIDRLDNRVDDLSKEVRSGFAGLAAMSALVPNARSSGDTQISIGTGGYRDAFGVALGAFHYINNGTLVNVGASYATGDKANVSWRAGITFGF
ncbi:MAG: YadA-like family protein [Alphaproteobacteria bacterium]|nr:YadA-like family protein [Alphaproteobacteria bacterium]